MSFGARGVRNLSTEIFFFSPKTRVSQRINTYKALNGIRNEKTKSQFSENSF